MFLKISGEKKDNKDMPRGETNGCGTRILEELQTPQTQEKGVRWLSPEQKI